MSKHIVEMLNQDLEGEHAAIIQYLTHAYSMGEGEVACEIEAIAREEMRHLDWLAETIVELGGVPSMNRGMMRLGDHPVPTWMHNDVLQEEDAIVMYRKHIKAVTEPKVKRLLQRILSDEEAHHAAFSHLVEKVARKKMADRTGPRGGRIAGMLNWGIEHEYTVVLQYLLHAYLAKDEEVKEELHDQAVNEMQHLGWLSEGMIDRKGTPRMEHTSIDRSRDMRDMLKADIAIERQVAAEYGRYTEEVKDKKLKQLLARIRDHEVYHDQVFSDHLKRLGKKK
ncbi:MAG: ferritin-like domain-containing protein [Chloroflexota bacterium]